MGIAGRDRGWLVFEPNYRGSIGYGDQFTLGIVPNIVSKPGKDILEGVDALVKDGIADPDNLTIGGYSYGGYMTNWLITQNYEVPRGGYRRRRGGACGQLGQRRHHLRRRLLSGRPALGHDEELQRRGGHLADQ